MAKACPPHHPALRAGGWFCNDCGKPLLRLFPVPRLKLWAMTRALRREIEMWRNG